MGAYLIRRLLYAVPIVLGVTLVTFVLFNALLPPDVLAANALGGKNVTAEQIETWKKQNGYDLPRWPWLPPEFAAPHNSQFGRVCVSLLTFNFGYSEINKQNINAMLWREMWPSFFLTLPAFLLGTVLSLGIGLFVAYFRGTYLDLTGVVLCVIGMSVPVLIYIIFGQYVLGIVLRYFPVYGWAPPPFGWKFLLLPVLIAVIGSLGGDVRLYRTIFLEQINQDYVRTARAKGLSEAAVMVRHVLPNAMIPILTLLVIQIPYLFIGSLLLERYFGIPGLGARMLEAITQADYMVLRALVYIGSIMFVVGNVLTDICYSLVDPRVRLR